MDRVLVHSTLNVQVLLIRLNLQNLLRRDTQRLTGVILNILALKNHLPLAT